MVFRTLGALDPGILVLLNITILGPLPSSTTSSNFLLPLTSTYLFLILFPTNSFTLVPPSISSFLLLCSPIPSYFLLAHFTSFCILLLPSTSFYFFLPPFHLLLSPGLVWGGGVSDDYGPFGLLTWEIEIGNEPWTFIY